MSTTGEAADVDGSGQPATSNSAAVLNSSSPGLASCSECRRSPSVVFCLSCKEALCELCDTKVVHTSKATSKHERMKVYEYRTVMNGVSDSPPTDAEMKTDEKNKFCFFNPYDHRIHLLPRLASLVTDPNAQPSLAAFIGPTGVGKSMLLRLLISLDGAANANQMPLAGAPNDPQSTSADMHMYAGGQVRTDSPYPLLYIDSEGSHGSMEPLAILAHWETFCSAFQGRGESYKTFVDNRSRHVLLSYPRMLYIFSDVICYVYDSDWRQHARIVKPLLKWGRLAANGAANQHRPQLILIFNKQRDEVASSQNDDFRKTFKRWIEGDKSRSQDELQRYFSDPLICFIPHSDTNSALVLDRVRRLRQEIWEGTERSRKFRKNANQLFTRRELQNYMQLAADTFSKDPKSEFDIYKESMDKRPTSVGLAGCIVEFRRAVEEANSLSSRRSERYRISLSVVQKRIGWSVLLHMARLNVKLSVGANAKLNRYLQMELKEAQKDIDGELPCAGFRRHSFLYFVNGHTSHHCDTVHRLHAGMPHASGQAATGEAVRWDGSFELDDKVKDAADTCRLVDLVESALQNVATLDVKAIRTQLLEVRQLEHDNYRWLESFTSYRVCVSCMVDLPTEVLSCGHIICAMCAKELADSPSQKMVIKLKCPVCFSDADWYPKDLPPLAGYRILSLDGGGVRGIVELLSLQRMMSYFHGMHVKDLFDIIVGTSTGGIIALALTVHAPKKQPKSLQEVIQLFEKLCTRVFSTKMLRFGAKYKPVLRFCQYFGIYNTKYKSDNLLKLLEQHFGEQPLLGSCVGGPHVIVTSCERDNKVAGAWFTSYNRPMLENDCDDLYQQAHRERAEQPTAELLFGRVPDNHLFSVKDAAAATSAAGTYFPSYEAGNRFWTDGGLRFNCPVGIAIQEARTMWHERQASAVISLGCGELSYDKVPKHSESLIEFLDRLVDVVTDSQTQYRAARKHLKQLQPRASGCCLRLNPTIEITEGDNCELDDAEKIPFLRETTNRYLDNDGHAGVEEAANLVFAALFYLDVETDQDSLEQKFHIRSRAALPRRLQEVFTNSSDSSSPPFSVTVPDAPGAGCEFFWAQFTWEQNVMNLPFKLVGLPMRRPLDIEVKLHKCLPGITAPEGCALLISGMPCSLRAAIG